MIAVFTALALFGQIPNAPFVRSKVRLTSGLDYQHCLYWTEGQNITWKANGSGDPETPGDTEFDAMRLAFAEWNKHLTDCGNLLFVEGARTSSHQIGWKRDASVTNENILLFRQTSCSDVVPPSDSCWADDAGADGCGNKWDCWEHQSAAIALTTTTYEPQSGRILDSDVEFNSAPTSTSLGFLFTTVDSPTCTAGNYSTNCVAWDIENTLTHEIGHMMGLEHTSNPGSTMNPTAPPGELSKRELDPGTASFVCTVYAKGETTHDCVIKPVSSKLGSVVTGCSCGSAGGVALVPLLLLLLRRRRKPT